MSRMMFIIHEWMDISCERIYIVVHIERSESLEQEYGREPHGIGTLASIRALCSEIFSEKAERREREEEFYNRFCAWHDPIHSTGITVRPRWHQFGIGKSCDLFGARLPVMNMAGRIAAHEKMSYLRYDNEYLDLSEDKLAGSTGYLEKYFADHSYIRKNSSVLDGCEIGSYQDPRSHNILREAATAKQSIDTAGCVERKLIGLQWQDVWLKFCPGSVPCKLNRGKDPRQPIRERKTVPGTHRKMRGRSEREARCRGETLSMDRRCMAA